jgi:hypothetical protein
LHPNITLGSKRFLPRTHRKINNLAGVKKNTMHSSVCFNINAASDLNVVDFDAQLLVAEIPLAHGCCQPARVQGYAQIKTLKG